MYFSQIEAYTCTWSSYSLSLYVIFKDYECIIAGYIPEILPLHLSKSFSDYAIQGIPVTPVNTSICHFKYGSKFMKVGRFNSPRHPSNYPADIECIFQFFMKPGEKLRITFENFKISEGTYNK